jgi:monoterpene epsilon-lactone hydrolase
MKSNIDKETRASLKARIIHRALKTINFSGRTFAKLLNDPGRNTGIFAPERISRRLRVLSREIDGFNILTVSKSENINKHIILLHGGAYIAEAVKGHKVLMEELALSYNFRVTVPDFPLAPENKALKTLGFIEKAYREIRNVYPEDKFFLFGDSSGGGLAMALLQMMKQKDEIDLPVKTALVSPWLDVSMSNHGIDKYLETDILLDRKALIECGKLYAGSLELKDPLVSPMYGNLEDLPPIKIWVSDDELFYPDCLLLNEKLNSAQGSSSTISVKNRMIHDWIVLPVREAKETISDIAAFYNS